MFSSEKISLISRSQRLPRHECYRRCAAKPLATCYAVASTFCWYEMTFRSSGTWWCRERYYYILPSIHEDYYSYNLLFYIYSSETCAACRVVFFLQNTSDQTMVIVPSWLLPIISLLPRSKGPPALPTRAETASASQRPARCLWHPSSCQWSPSCSACFSDRSGCKRGSPCRWSLAHLPCDHLV